MNPAFRWGLCALAAAALACFFLPAFAADPGPGLGDQVSGEVTLSEEERAALEPVLAHYYALQGSKPALRRVISACAECGCRGAPMGDILGLVVQEMRAGVTDEKAADKVVEAMRAVCDRCKDKSIVLSGETILRGVKSRLETTPPSPGGTRVY